MTDQMEPALIPTVGCTIALMTLLVCWITVCLLDHTNAFYPYMSTFMVFSPESHLGYLMGTWYAIFATISQWIWCDAIRIKLNQRPKSILANVLLCLLRLLSLLMGVGEVGLFCISMVENNELHYNFTAVTFVGLTASLAVDLCLNIRFLRSGRMFVVTRSILLLQCIVGIICFKLFDVLLPMFGEPKSLFHRYPEEKTYTVDVLCAASEWCLISALIGYTAVQAVHLYQFKLTLPKVYRLEYSQVSPLVKEPRRCQV
ncbi:hypothetical protein EG68_00302 [Paragonimus skrjabini miyazakii]|uniref:CWH43-like N-terminal domain-containing protein n=1 Tax=Paragonimus skrjabini miyazakii TaxID=59628 RepID=A0A8S9Z4K9_9TREM|nr:hypothetical protein EG68_00302 [Paragonimus skrjabini miyazakii]